MRVFLAGATGVIGRRLVPLLVAAGHDVAGMARSADKAEDIARQGALPVICDVFDAETLAEAMTSYRPDLVMHQLTDLPDDMDLIAQFAARNNRIRTVGTRNLVAAAERAQAKRFVAQSIAWTPPGGGQAIAEHEEAVLDAGGVVVRYGAFYGPGTYYGTGELPPVPRVHVDDAARRTMSVLADPSGIVVIDDGDGAGAGPR